MRTLSTAQHKAKSSTAVAAARATMRKLQTGLGSHSSPRTVAQGWPEKKAVVFWGLDDEAQQPAAVAARAEVLRERQQLDVALYQHALERIEQGWWGD